MAYRVISFFTDMQDGDHAYHVGDTFPRDEHDVSKDRIKELSGTQNKRGIALIEEVQDAEPVKKATVSTFETVEEPEAPVENEPHKRGRKRSKAE